MDRKPFGLPNESVRERLRNCRSEAEMQNVIADAGLQELSADMPEGISGGYPIPHSCPRAVNERGQPGKAC